MASVKISIAIDERALRLARRAAKAAGMSLSAYIGRGLAEQLDDQVRRDAARQLHETWGRASIPTEADRARFVLAMSRRAIRRSTAA